MEYLITRGGEPEKKITPKEIYNKATEEPIAMDLLAESFNLTKILQAKILHFRHKIKDKDLQKEYDELFDIIIAKYGNI